MDIDIDSFNFDGLELDSEYFNRCDQDLKSQCFLNPCLDQNEPTLQNLDTTIESDRDLLLGDMFPYSEMFVKEVPSVVPKEKPVIDSYDTTTDVNRSPLDLPLSESPSTSQIFDEVGAIETDSGFDSGSEDSGQTSPVINAQVMNSEWDRASLIHREMIRNQRIRPYQNAIRKRHVVIEINPGKRLSAEASRGLLTMALASSGITSRFQGYSSCYGLATLPSSSAVVKRPMPIEHVDAEESVEPLSDHFYCVTARKPIINRKRSRVLEQQHAGAMSSSASAAAAAIQQQLSAVELNRSSQQQQTLAPQQKTSPPPPLRVQIPHHHNAARNSNEFASQPTTPVSAALSASERHQGRYLKSNSFPGAAFGLASSNGAVPGGSTSTAIKYTKLQRMQPEERLQRSHDPLLSHTSTSSLPVTASKTCLGDNDIEIIAAASNSSSSLKKSYKRVATTALVHEAVSLQTRSRTAKKSKLV